MFRVFSRAWSASHTKRARSFYFVAGRLFIAIAVGERREDSPLTKETDDA